MKLLRGVNRLFLIAVIIPTFISAVYFGLICRDQYTSVSAFLIRSPQSSGLPALGGLLKSVGGFSNSEGDAYTIRDFITSRSAMIQLNNEQHIKDEFSRGGVDVLSRFPGISTDDSLENFYLYYKKNIVDVQVDVSSSIVTLSTNAFDANQSQKINERLLELGEQLVNKMNERARLDLISAAQRDVDTAQENDRAATLAMAKYRNNAGVIDPEHQSAIPLQQVGKLQDDLIATRVQIAQMERLSPANPGLPNLQQRAVLLQQEIDDVNQKIAGQSGQSLASKAGDFQHLALEKEFADKILASAITSLEQARVEAERQQLYLERIAAPSLPDQSMTPHRLRNILATFLLGLVLWGVLTIVIGGVKEHYDR